MTRDSEQMCSTGFVVSNDSRLVQKHDVVSASLVDGRLEIVRRYRSNMTYGNGWPVPDRVVKEIYGVGTGGKIELIESIEGRHIPRRFVDETFEFPV